MKTPLSALLLVLSAAVTAVTAGAAPPPAPAPTASAEPAPHVLVALTAHAELGDTGQPTGYYLSEVAHPWRAFTDAGYDLTFATPDGAAAPLDPKSEDRDDPVNVAFLDDADVQVQLKHPHAFRDLKADDFDAVFVPGGHGTMFDLPDDPHLPGLIAAVYEGGGVVGAVCHGPAALVNVTLPDGTYLVAGKRVAAFTNAEEEAVGLTDVMPFLLADRLRERGAEPVPADNFAAQTVTDGRLVTGQNPASSEGVAAAFVGAMTHSESGR